jgi:hypothetical protein
MEQASECWIVWREAPINMVRKRRGRRSPRLMLFALLWCRTAAESGTVVVGLHAWPMISPWPSTVLGCAAASSNGEWWWWVRGKCSKNACSTYTRASTHLRCGGSV